MDELKNIKISADLHHAVKMRAALDKISITECIERCLNQWVAAWAADDRYTKELKKGKARAKQATEDVEGV